MQQSNQNMENKNNDLTEIITQALNEMKMELGESFNIDKVNLAELERRTGITRAKLRRLKSNGFIDKPHGLTGRKAEHTVLSGYTAVIDNLLGKSITNASLIHERIGELGYSGGLTSIKDYIAQHRDLIPAKRQLVAPQGSRGTRYQSEPGESYQMDWGFVTVEDDKGNEYKPSCLIIDEVGRCVFDKENTRMFFDVIDRRYNKEGPNTMIFTSNKSPDKWGEFFGEDSSLLCALDRIFDDALVFMIKGNSYRGKKCQTVALSAGDPSPLPKTKA